MAWEWLGPTATMVGALTGASVGIVGILAGARTTRRGQEHQQQLLLAQMAAEDHRTITNHRRTVYARFLAAVDVAVRLGELLRRAHSRTYKTDATSSDPETQRKYEDRRTRFEHLRSEADKVVDELYRLQAEVQLVGGIELGNLARAVVSKLGDLSQDDQRAAFKSDMDALISMMHTDVSQGIDSATRQALPRS